MRRGLAGRCKGSFDFSDGNPYWYALNAGHARIITYSTDSNLTEGSPQRLWIKKELEAANTPGEWAPSVASVNSAVNPYIA
jgi:hypothetical protein